MRDQPKCGDIVEIRGERRLGVVRNASLPGKLVGISLFKRGEDNGLEGYDGFIGKRREQLRWVR